MRNVYFERVICKEQGVIDSDTKNDKNKMFVVVAMI